MLYPGARMIFRRRFAAVVSAQLDLFERDHADLLQRYEEALRAYDRGPGDEAEERYGAYLDLVEEGAEILAGMRDAYALGLDARAEDAYVAAFERAVAKRLPRFAIEVRNQ